MYSSLIWAVLILIFIIIYKKQLSPILDSIAGIGKKTKNIQYKGLNINLGSETKTMAISRQEVTNEKQTQFQKAYQNIIITNEEKIIRGQLIDAHFTNDQAIDILIYHLANKNFYIKLLEIDRLIFIEQISLLFFLNEEIAPCNSSTLLSFYNDWLKKSDNKKYLFQDFLNFLIHNGLITEDLSGYKISNFGKEYLTFLIRIGRYIPNFKNTNLK
ncbi:hypothetical protein OQJ19_04365 [Fluoribacter gormanii]|uniref:hypothetical protein n=1 Tax=Fluoribacter gormanii TaxID=464 RepID=UPI0022443133|nr:hypothetical protein [Fluoribacter gormanii]MCW8469890.1 hypothetical protein [Fluoribacter gormanii]